MDHQKGIEAMEARLAWLNERLATASSSTYSLDQLKDWCREADQLEELLYDARNRTC